MISNTLISRSIPLGIPTPADVGPHANPHGMEGMVYTYIAMLPAGHYVVMVCNSIHMAKPLRSITPYAMMM
jgi:hypothetical protein